MEKEKNTCTIKIQNFEGPLDLLYHLIEKNKMSIYEVKIEDITDQYMEHIYTMQQFDMEVASEFLLMAATLLLIKSKLLLPIEKKSDKQEETVDSKEDLLLKILHYKKYKEFSQGLREREAYWEKIYYKGPESIEFIFEEEPLDIAPFALKQVYIKMLQKNRAKRNEKSKEDMVKIIQFEKVSLKSKIREVVRVLMDKVSVAFSEIFLKKGKSKVEVVTGFLAILELAKMKKVELQQKQVFSEILIHRKDVSEAFVDSLPEDEQNIG